MLSLYGGAPGGHLPQPLTDLQESLHHSRRIPEAPSPPRTPWTETVCTRCSSPIWWPLWWGRSWFRSEEHTSEFQSRGHLVCRLLLEKKNRLLYDLVERHN